MKPIVAIAPLLAALALGGCGQSSADKAQSKVCDARADISKQLDTLKGLTPSAANANQIQSSLKAIGDDLKQIKDAQGDLSGARKSEVEQANKEFESQLQQIASSLGSSSSAGDLKTQIASAVQQLAAAYKQSFAKVDCSS